MCTVCPSVKLMLTICPWIPAMHDHRVVGDDGADAGQIDRHVVLGDHSGDDRHRRYRSRRWRG